MRHLLPAALVLGLSALLGVHVAQGDPPPPAAARPTHVSTLIYPPEPRRLRMDHAHPAHRTLECSRCHASPSAAGPARPSLLASEASCAGCHAERIDRSEPSAERCGYCHLDFDPARGSAPPAPLAQPARLRFDHARHRSQPCAGCHASGPAGQPALPDMQTCLSCHRGSRALTCQGCHLADPAGRLRTRFPEGQLIPSGPFLGIAHDADFSVRHRWLAADHGAACRSCHQEDECARCHDAKTRPRGIHPNDYLSLHAQEAQRAANRCTSCHATQSFCAACHARLGIAQRSAPDLASPQRYHPPPALWSRGPTLHAREAQRSLQTCVTCHAERDCVECHGSRAAGFSGSSPHPADFSRDCARLFARDPRPCMTCHQASDRTLLQRCR